MGLWHRDSLVILVHFWQGEAVRVHLKRGLVPPDREVFLQRATQVGAVRSGLRNDLVEDSVGALPVGRLN